MFQFPRGVQRVDVDNGEARAQRAEQSHRILQQIGQHDRDPVALGQAKIVLQVGGKIPAQLIQFTVADRYRHVGIGREVAELAATLFESVLQRRVLVNVDLSRNAFRILLEPDLIHVFLPVSKLRCCCAVSNTRRSATLRVVRPAGVEACAILPAGRSGYTRKWLPVLMFERTPRPHRTSDSRAQATHRPMDTSTNASPRECTRCNKPICPNRLMYTAGTVRQPTCQYQPSRKPD